MRIITRSVIPDPDYLYHEKYAKAGRLGIFTTILYIALMSVVAIIAWPIAVWIIGLYVFIAAHEGMHLAAAYKYDWKREFLMIRLSGAAVSLNFNGFWSKKRLREFWVILIAPLIAVPAFAFGFSLISGLPAITWAGVLALSSVGDLIAIVKKTIEVRKCRTIADLKRLENLENYHSSRSYYISQPKIVFPLRDWKEPPFYAFKKGRKVKA